MYISSTEFLSMLAHYSAHLVEKQASGNSRPEDAMILVKSNSGSNLEIKGAGYWAAPLKLPRSIFDDFLKARLIREDPSAGKPGRRVFRLTQDGLQRGLAATPFRRSRPPILRAAACRAGNHFGQGALVVGANAQWVG
jgi:hypothetical protein